MMKIKSTPKISLGTNIKNIIEGQNLKKANIIREMQLAGIPMTKQRFYKLENNLANITADELVMLATILDCDISDFFEPNTNNKTLQKRPNQ